MPEVKKYALLNIGKILHIGKNMGKSKCCHTSLVCPKYSWSVWGESQYQEDFAILSLTWQQYFQHLT